MVFFMVETGKEEKGTMTQEEFEQMMDELTAAEIERLGVGSK